MKKGGKGAKNGPGSISRSLKLSLVPFSKLSQLKALNDYEWPGNVRQLRNTVEQAVLVGESETISEQDIALPVIASAPSTGGALSGASKITLALAERELIEQALIKDGWNISKAARALGVSRPMLRYRIRRHGLTLPADEGMPE